MRRLKTVRRPPIYPNEPSHLPCSSLTHPAAVLTPSIGVLRWIRVNDRTQGQYLPTSPSVHFESAAYSVDEGATVAVKVKLSKAPGSETVIRITGTNRAGASDDDYTGVPDSLTFGAADTEKTITFAATDDSVDDDGEKVELLLRLSPRRHHRNRGRGR